MGLEVWTGTLSELDNGSISLKKAFYTVSTLHCLPAQKESWRTSPHGIHACSGGGRKEQDF